ncbi:phage late control D family protein [Pseudoalteromonas sp. T1lg65]|uniref:phage late control D family protein n=1 Tax=Pseudoalteromonas sp. T1lg65 TaxID=2077101 RepID=UPI003F7922B1
MNLQPNFSIKANGNEVADTLKNRVVEVSVTTRTGLLSDTCAVRFENLEKLPIATPGKAASLEIAMGYKEGVQDSQSPLEPLGIFEVGAYELSGPRRALSLFGNKTLWHTALKAPKQRSWPKDGSDEPLLLSDVIATIAGEYGLEPKVGPAFSGIELSHIEQSESDMQLLTRLSEQFDAVMKIANDKLIFMAKGTGLSLSGQALPKVKLGKADIHLWQLSANQNRSVDEVEAYYYDLQLAERKPLSVGGGAIKTTLPYVYATEAQATNAAKAKLQRLQRCYKQLQLEIVGAPKLVAGGVVTIAEVDDELDGDWFVSEVKHVINPLGFRSILQCEALTK